MVASSACVDASNGVDPAVVDTPPEQTVSPARLRANRANARKSTGPITAEGKVRSSQNALVHGLRAASILGPGEDARQLAGYRISILRATNPRNAVEMEYVEQIIRAGWKLRRYQAAEIFALEDRAKSFRRPAADGFAGAVLARTLWNEPEFQRLPRYEQQYTRMMNRALDELRKLKKDPLDQTAEDFASEILDTEMAALEELDAEAAAAEQVDAETAAAEQPGTIPTPASEAKIENAPNEPKPAQPELSDDPTDTYDASAEHLKLLDHLRKIKARLEARLGTAPEPVVTG